MIKTDFLISLKTYVVGTQKNCLNEAVFFKHPKHMVKIIGKKIQLF